jgi:hypothetical protein
MNDLTNERNYDEHIKHSPSSFAAGAAVLKSVGSTVNFCADATARVRK